MPTALSSRIAMMQRGKPVMRYLFTYNT